MNAISLLQERTIHRVVLPAAVAAMATLGAVSTVHARPAPDSFAEIAAKVAPAVVNIATERGAGGLAQPGMQPDGQPFSGPPDDRLREFMERFFGGARPEFRNPGPPVTSLGSGFIVDRDGYVVTNNHVIDGANKIQVRLAKGEEFDATLIGRDARTDLALLKIDAGRPLPFVSFGDSDGIRAGDWVVTIGNPFGLGGSVTAGIVSARGRDLQGGSLVDFLQIDAPINQGNSGGPAFDTEGRVIGVNTAIFSPNGGNVGIGFAIPSNTAKRVIAELRENGEVTRGWLGVQVQPVTPDIAESLDMKAPAGALVAGVAPGGPAAKAGVEPGDVITKWDGKPVAKLRDLPRLVAATEIGRAVEVELLRGGKFRSLTVKTGRMPKTDRVASLETPSSKVGTLEGIGIRVVDLDAAARRRFGIDETVEGVAVLRVEDGSAADRRGIRPGDVIQRVAQKPVRSAAETVETVRDIRKNGGKAVMLLIDRKGADRFVAVRFADA